MMEHNKLGKVSTCYLTNNEEENVDIFKRSVFQVLGKFELGNSEKIIEMLKELMEKPE